MHVLSLGTDRHMFTKTSPVYERTALFAQATDGYHVIVLHTGAVAPIHDAPVYVYPTNSRTRLGSLVDAYRIGRDIILGMSTRDIVLTAQDPFETGLVMYLLSRRYRLPLQVQLHTDIFSPYFKTHILQRIRLCIARFLLPRVEGIRVVHDGLRERLIAQYRPKGTVSVLPVYLDTTRLEHTDVPVQPRGIASYVVLMLSRLAPEKRIADGIEVFARVYKARPGGVLWIVGSGPEEERLRARVDALGISHTVIFFGWQEHPSAFYKSSDVLLCTSAFEGYGLTFIEAALCGCPVVSTPVGVAASSLFIHKKNSEIVSRVGDIQGLYEGVLTVLDGAGESYASSLKEDVRLTLLSQKEYTTQYVTLLQSLRYDPKT